MRRDIGLVFGVLLSLTTAACATSTAEMPEREKVHIYTVSFDDVWTAAQRSLTDVKCLQVNTDKAGGSIQAKCVRSKTAAAFGEAPFGLYVAISQDGQKVRVEANAEYLHPAAMAGGTQSRDLVLRFLKAVDARLGVITVR
ncbi:MAG TPA: hypothetical protein PLS53_17280 [Thermoanaerobaculaceae bacterium]|nr:hypothetical protein [Thermoanaerobaculaceae bacterium]